MPKDRRHALPVCAVETRSEALDLVTLACVRAYDGRDVMTAGFGGWERDNPETIHPLGEALLVANTMMQARRRLARGSEGAGNVD